MERWVFVTYDPKPEEDSVFVERDCPAIGDPYPTHTTPYPPGGWLRLAPLWPSFEAVIRGRVVSGYSQPPSGPPAKLG